MADISLTSYNHATISINSTLEKIHEITSLTANVYINSESFGTIEYGYVEHLEANIIISTSSASLLIFGDDEFISDNIQIISHIDGELSVKISCDNCKFSGVIGLTKFTPLCYRSAKFQNKTLNCNMYKYV